MTPSTAKSGPMAGLTAIAGLDVVRGVAAVLVVALHACVPYLTRPMPGLAWSVRDTASPSVDFVFWSIELIVMPLFLIIAGFLAWLSMVRRGSAAVTRNRARRLLIPLAFGVFFVLPIDLYVWVLGWVGDGIVAPIKLRSLKFDGVVDRDLWGLSHLWFLQYLFLYVSLLALARRLFADRISPPSAGRWMFAACFGVAVVCLCFEPGVVWGFQHAFAPVPAKFIYHAAFFAIGVSVAIGDPKMSQIGAIAPRVAMPAVLIAIAAVLLGQWTLRTDAEGSTIHASARIGLAALTAAAAIGVSLVAIGGVSGRIARVSPGIRYLAAASFWVYLVHHPILGLVHIDLKWMMPGVAPTIKATAACIVSLSVSLATYEVFVRRTWLGNLLGFTFSMAESTPSRSGDKDSVESATLILIGRDAFDDAGPNKSPAESAFGDEASRRAA